MAGVVKIVRDWLEDRLGARITGTHDREPPDLIAKMPLLVVTKLGGGDIDVNFSTPTIAVDTYAAGHDAADDLATLVHRLIRYQLRNYLHTDGSVITTVRTLGLPRDLPYNSRNQIFKVGGSYQIYLQTRQPAL
jgi:hypothetical protein